jgi:hypothetical protein
MADKKVVVSGGGDNLYKIVSSGGRFRVYQVTVGSFFIENKSSIGETRSNDDALSLIKSHAGQSIKKISDW